VLKIVNRHLRRLENYMGRRIGFLASDLKLRKGSASPIGDFTAGCMKRWARSNAALLVNSELAAGLSSGPVTTGAIYKVIPHDTDIVFVKIRGSELAGALEDKTLSDISVSGLKILTGESGIKKIETDYGPLIPNRVYHLAVPDSIVNNKDFPILPNAMEFANSKRFLREILGWCFSLHKITVADNTNWKAAGEGKGIGKVTVISQSTVTSTSTVP
jgi:2',3'-cyclic-nucleotide 2'-phosphodiesterase (5'-nucleotidase family)